MIEAMACGTPVIAYNRGSVPEIIDDGLTGFIVEDEISAVAVVGRLAGTEPRRDPQAVRDALHRAPHGAGLSRRLSQPDGSRRAAHQAGEQRGVADRGSSRMRRSMRPALRMSRRAWIAAYLLAMTTCSATVKLDVCPHCRGNPVLLTVFDRTRTLCESASPYRPRRSTAGCACHLTHRRPLRLDDLEHPREFVHQRHQLGEPHRIAGEFDLARCRRLPETSSASR